MFLRAASGPLLERVVAALAPGVNLHVFLESLCEVLISNQHSAVLKTSDSRGNLISTGVWGERGQKPLLPINSVLRPSTA